MNINAYDLVIFHKNVDRVVGKEIFPNNTLANNDMDIMRSIEKLIKAGLLIKTNEFDISIYKKTLTELKEIVAENNLKKSGTKSMLINRIKENINLITNLDLPFVYKATDKGENTLIDTKYLLSFDMGWDSDIGTSINRAYYLAENHIPKDCSDKVAEIYKLEFKNNYDNVNLDLKSFHDKRILNFRQKHILDSLLRHYKDTKDYNEARKYVNIIYYFDIKELLYGLQEERYKYYSDGVLDLEGLKNNINPNHTSIYERIIFNENLSNENIFKLFKDDVKEFNELDDMLTKIYKLHYKYDN